MSVFPGNYATAELGVFWDTEECEIAEDSNAAETTQKMKESISKSGHNGPVSIRAYGDKKDHDFVSAGVNFTHFPAGEKHARHTKMLEDIVSWAAENPEPSTLMLIMRGDPSGDFMEVVELLKTRKNYRFVHVAPKPRPTMVILMVRPSGN